MPQQPSQPRDYKLIVEKDVVVPLRDGAILYADVYRPDGGSERFPAIMNIGPYQKDKLWIPPDDLEEKANPYGLGDGQPDVVVPARIRLRACRCPGSGKSPGRSDPSSYQEAVDFDDAIEWIARRDWCSGNIGTLGIPTTPTVSGASPICSRRPSKRSSPGKAAPISIAIRPFMAASLRWGFSTPGSPTPTCATTI